MRITCVMGPFLPVPPLLGGAVEKIWQSLCTEFASNGHSVTLISRQFRGLPNHERRRGVTYLRIPSTDAPSSKLLYRAMDILYALRAHHVLPESDITITNSVSLPLLLPRDRAGKVVVSVARFPKGQMNLYRSVDRLQAVSRPVAAAIRQQSPNVAHLVRVIPNCLSDAFLKAKAASARNPRREILFVGRIAREKGIELLLEAFLGMQDCDDWHLTILGPSDTRTGGDGAAYKQGLLWKAANSGGRIAFEEPIFDDAALANRMREAEIFVYPSIAEHGESFGMAPLEAMACGCATLVSDLGCFRDFVEEGQNALVFNHRDATGSSLAQSLQRLVGDSGLRRAIGTAGQATARQFSPSRVASQFLDDFTQLQVAATD